MLKVGIVGLGVISSVHLDVIAEAKDVDLVAICDVDVDKLNAIKCDNKYTNVKSMILEADLDVVHICTPHFLHCEMIIAFVKAGINVICEKPAVLNGKEVQKVKAALSNSDVKVCVTLQNRYNKSTELLCQEYKELGQLNSIIANVNWCRDESYYIGSPWRGKMQLEGGGVIINQAIHTIDLVQLIGGNVKEVNSRLDNFSLEGVIEVEDTATIMIDFESGVKGILNLTNANETNIPVEIQLNFENGRIIYMDNKVISFNGDEVVVLSVDEVDKNFKSYFGASHRTCISKFYKAVKNDTDDFISFDKGCEVIYLIDAIKRSDKEQKKVGIHE